MEKVEDPRVGETKEVRPKGARGMSLKACVAKAAGWTLEKANAKLPQAKRLMLIKHNDLKQDVFP